MPRRILGVLVDRPSVVTIAMFAAVVAHALMSIRYPSLNFWSSALPDGVPADGEPARSVYLALSGAAATSAGFAGVVIVFGLTTSSQSFRKFRTAGGAELRASWLSVIASSFAATIASLAAAVTAMSIVGPWLFELGVLLWLHGISRMLFLLRGLMGLVKRDDADASRADRVVSSADLFSRRRAG
ncbi:hypothetical protein [Georgenia sp. AZ-5]|uniref:hypothetical protein n=1 Tax=Georgenia sp. AZ-5 TaxID=3367526 RepID=UPI0037545006